MGEEPVSDADRLIMGTPEVREYERERAESYRGAALIGYGALQAFNSTGRFYLVLETMEKILWPDLPSPPNEQSRRRAE